MRVRRDWDEEAWNRAVFQMAFQLGAVSGGLITALVILIVVIVLKG
jgi:hypothetical protein